MSKNIRRILIAGIIVVVSGLLLVIFKYAFPEPVEDTQLAVSPTPTEAPVNYIIKDNGDNVTGMKCTYSDGSTFDIGITANGDGTYSYSATPKDDFFDYNTSRFRSMMYTMTSLTATQLVEQKPEDLSIYGLDKPQFIMEITFKNGDKTILYVGNETPIAGNYYVMTNKDNTVYTIGEYLSSLVMRKPIMYRNIVVFPTYTDEDIYTNINYVGITRRDGTAIDLHLDSDFTMEGNKASSAYMMTSPVNSSCSDDKVQKNIMDVVATVKYDNIVCDIAQDKFKDYGFDKPARLKMSDISGNSIDIIIGKATGGSCYAALGSQYDAYLAGTINYLTVLSYSASSFTWIDTDYMELLNRAIWLLDIHDVSSIIYDMNGKVYDMELSEYDDVTGSGVNVVRVVSKMNDKDINETNTKRIFSRTLNFREVGTLAAGITYDPDYTYSITIKMKDGTSHVMTMNKINERQYACIIDGVATFYVYLSNIENLTIALDRAMDDREVSLVYVT